MKTLAGIVAGITLGAAMARGELQIASRGKAACVIITQPGATPAEQYAAEELATHLKAVTGAAFEVREAGDPAPASAILIGPGPLARKLFPELPLDRLGPEQLTMRVKDGRLLLAGGRPRGTLYAVYRFLQEPCGVRWWTPWAARIPSSPDLRVKDLARDETPAFESRYPYWFPAFDGDWSARNGCNGHEARLTGKHGGNITYAISKELSAGRGNHPLGFVHTTFWLAHPAEFIAAHPDWYSLVNGRGRVPWGQVCTTSPGLRDKLIERARQWLRDSPEASILSISQMDQGYPCECENCKAVDAREGSPSGAILEMQNYIAGKLGPEFPRVAFDTLAYQYSRKPPSTVRPASNVIVRLCSIECNFAAPMDDPSNRAFAEDIVGWSKICKRLYVWDYTTAFENYVLPHPNWFVLGPNVRFFHQHNVKGLFEQGAYQSNGSEMAELRPWVLAQLLWNPYQDDGKLIDEFLDGYYGPAAGRLIRQYMNLLAGTTAGFHMGCFVTPAANPPYLKFAVLSQAERLWQQAEDAARGDADLLWRVKQGHLPVRYAFLASWTQLRRECLAAGGKWPLPLSRKAVAEEWLAVATGPGPAGWAPMTLANERGQTPQAFFATVAGDVPDPVGATSLGVGNAGLLGGDQTDPEDDVEGRGGYAQDLPEERLRPLHGNWADMTCAPANPPGTPAHQRHPYQSWQDSPACAVFLNKPENIKWYVGFRDGGGGGPTPEAPYFIAVKFDRPFVLTHFTLTTSQDMPGRDPRCWAIQGSDSGAAGDWKDLYRCSADDRSGSPLRETPRCETLLFTSFTSGDMADVATSADAAKLTARLKGQPIGLAHFPRQARAYAWYRFAAFSCFNSNGMDIPDPARPAGFALGQLEFFGKPQP